ncbi:MAG: HAMP domain-containing protein [Ignavibacteriales bacterium]|nr:HAMP domain-containing protein [Ignavibacteriales bacterium]
MGKIKRKYLLILTLCFVSIIALTFIYESINTDATKRNWQNISSDIKDEQKRYIQNEFIQFQQSILNQLEQLSTDRFVVTAINAKDDQDSLFDYLLRVKSIGTSIEIFDSNKNSVAWVNDYGPHIPLKNIVDSVSITIIQNPLFTYIAIIRPIIDNGKTSGYIAGKRLLDVNLPLSNRFINEKTFSNTFAGKLSVTPEFQFSNVNHESASNNNYSIPLIGLDNAILGEAHLPVPTIDEYLEASSNTINLIKGILEIIIFLLVIAFLKEVIRKFSDAIQFIIITILIWSARYLLIWTNVPNQLFPAWFNPKYYASPFGYGIAHSLGDLFLSSIFVMITILFLCYFYFSYYKTHDKISSYSNKYLKIISTALLVVIFLLIIRAMAAIFRSAVRDSTISLNDLTTLLPNIESTVLLFGLFFTLFSIVSLQMVIIDLIRRLISDILKKNKTRIYAWTVTCIILLMGGITFGLIQKSPLLSLEARAVLTMGLIAATYIATTTAYSNSGGNRLPRVGIVVFITAVLIMMPVLRVEMENKECASVENFSRVVIKPTNDWLSYLVDQTIAECVDSDAVKTIKTNDRQEYSVLAFKKWARSLLSTEGNICSIRYYNSIGEPISTFKIGAAISITDDSAIKDSIFYSRSYQVDRNIRGVLTRWHIRTSVMTDARSDTIGSVRVEITGNKLTLLKGEIPEILRTSSRQTPVGLEQPLMLTEYFRDTIVSSSEETFYAGRTLQTGIKEEIQKRNNFWIKEEFDGKYYESYYFKDENDPSAESIYNIRRQEPGYFLSFFWFIRIGFIFLILGVFIFIANYIWNIFNKKNKIFSFAEKLLISYLVVAVFPVLFFSYYNKQTTNKRVEVDLQSQLQDQTEIVVTELKRRFDISNPVSISRVYDSDCSNIAEDINIDFDIYSSTELSSTSMPELYDAELLDSHLDASAYQELFIRGRMFCSQKKVLGNLTYVVGYRPLHSEDGRIIGVISVPTLLKQSQRDMEMVQSNAVLFSIFGIVFAISIFLGLILSRQFGIPIQNLIEATREIARGNLSYKRKLFRSDELGELDRAFEKMSHDLKNKQDQLIVAQREAAWREMAKQVAHEIKNPLTPMKLSLQHLRAAFQDRAKNLSEIVEKVTSTTLEQIETLSKIATEFSHMAKMPARNMQMIDLHQILNESKNLFGEYKGVIINLNLNASRSIIRGDHDEVRRAFINILKNSVQALKEKGKITISSEDRNENIQIKIIDDGPGLNSEALEHLFELNFSTKSEGMGIGLAIVKKTVTDFGGTIEIQSNQGGGVVVSIIFPLI